MARKTITNIYEVDFTTGGKQNTFRNENSSADNALVQFHIYAQQTLKLSPSAYKVDSLCIVYPADAFGRGTTMNRDYYDLPSGPNPTLDQLQPKRIPRKKIVEQTEAFDFLASLPTS